MDLLFVEGDEIVIVEQDRRRKSSALVVGGLLWLSWCECG